MNLEDTRHNLIIVGKIFIVLGIIIIPVTILSYNSIDILIDSDWWHLDDHFSFGAFHFPVPWELVYIIPALYLLFSALLISAGLGLVYDKTWARKLAMVPAVIMLFEFPIGTALGVYLIFLVQQEKNLDGVHHQNSNS